ncbi:hypothetical protein JCM15519_20580 [Fundidesulfovibrio butyratiphilus]
MKGASNILRGSALLALARILGSGTAQLLYWMLARASMSDLGVYRTVLVFFFAAEALPLLGMNQYLVREMAKNPGATGACLRSAARLAAPVTLAGGAGLFLLAHSGVYGPDISRGLFWVLATLPASAVVLIAQSVLVGRDRSATLGLLQSAESCLRTFASIALLLLGFGVDSLLAVLALVRWLFAALYGARVLPLARPDPLRFSAKDSLRDFAGQIPVFAAITFLYIVFRFSPQAQIALIGGEAEAGVFAVGYQVMDLVLLVPTAVAVNFMPLLARAAEISPGNVARACGRLLALTSAAVLPCVILAGRLADPLVRVVFPKAWPDAVTAVHCMLWTAFLLCLDQALSTLLVACGRQDADLRSLAVGAAATVVLTPLAALWAGASGAAGALVCVALLLVAARLVAIRGVAPGLLRAGRLPLTLAGGTVMAGVTWAFRDPLSAVVAGSGAYGLMAAAFFAFHRHSTRKSPMAARHTTNVDARTNGPRIGLDAHILGSGKGGVEQCVRQLCRHLPGVAPQARFYFFIRRGYVPDWLLQPNAVFVPLPDAPLLAQRFLALPFLARRHGLDLLHVQRICPVLAGCPVVVSVHDIFPVLHPADHPGMRDAFVRALTGPSITLARLVLTVSETSRADILRRYKTPSDKVRVILNGVDPFPALAQTVQHSGEGRMLFVGALEPRKNLEVALRAFALFRKACPEERTQFVLVGGERQPGYRRRLETLAETLGLAGSVRFAGYVDDDTLAGLLRGARLLVAPSRAEGFNIPPLEAMAAGTPVVCSDIAVHRELFSGAVEFFPPDDPAGLADAMRRTWSGSPAREARLAAGRTLAARLTWERNAREHWNVYSSLTSAGHGRRP